MRYDLQEIVMRWKKSQSDKDLIDLRDGTYAYVKSLLVKYYNFRSYEEVDEIVSKTFFQVWTNIDTYNETISKYTTWVGAIALNEYRAYQSDKSLAKKHHHKYTMDLLPSSIEEKMDLELKIKKTKEKLKSIGTLGFILNEMFVNEVPQHILAERYHLNLNTLKTWTKRGKEIMHDLMTSNEKVEYFKGVKKDKCPYCGLEESKELMKLHVQICEHKEVKIYDL